MPRQWMPGEPEDDELERLIGADREAWRGDAHLDAEPWRADSSSAGPAEDAWRGSEHLADWPEASAGPEYWMYKRAESRPGDLP